jgi:UDP-N-acetylmuramoyl-L-alanyl-D-glutamate--2,6-diaminopimelate ligase
MTAIALGQPFEVVVDYAHTPSSFGTIFPPLYGRINSGGGRIIALFGSAGVRDMQKRREQGKIAALYSGVIILTDEDPRGENPTDILEEIAAGVESAYAAAESAAGEKAVIKPGNANEKARAQVFRRGENLFLIPDRPAAIRKAMSLAGPKDLVLLLGKGHENSIIYADRIMPFDEIEEAKRALELLCPAAL